ncbi:peptidase S9 prolyl oligopeptidase active site domain-containing protein [Hyphomonas adhaerens MHS-3]|uniref:Peptidase S9 prolyl oligopeptidase active site domain-containing protein n=1 Tax=Hyphomonas adhaerens MHS-3 TaxID=1280949 RepID=A0A069E3Y0_9PROT|nr:alpha/beta fold hydrolase [Hyphomonas adhaerens]KCZ84672.1 peptidase S9 prolyl oligopeptidase active site domain-containing protein [Hyphomonas adhaerens MHS-3]
MPFIRAALSLLAILSAASLFTALADAPPLEIYGRLPEVSSVAISDDASRVAMLRHDPQGDYVLVRDLSGDLQTGFRVENFKPLSVDFLGDNYVLLRASATEALYDYAGRFEYGFGFIFDVANEKVYQLLENEGSLVPGADASHVVGFLEDSSEILIPTFTYAARNSAVNSVGAGASGFGSSVFRVKLDSGRVRVFEGDRQSSRLQAGSRAKYEYAIDWVIAPDGTVIAREDYDSKLNRQTIYSKKSGSWETVYSGDPEDTRFIGGRALNLVGMTPDESAILVSGLTEDLDESMLYALSFEGDLSKTPYSKPGADVAQVLTDDNRHVFGVRYAGLQPSYTFADPALQTAFDTLQEKMPDFSLLITDWSANFSQLVLKISGGVETGSYYLFDPAAGRLSQIAKSYEIAPGWVGPMQTIEYPASDGTRISAVVTWPAGDGESNLPTIVLPHGGPAGFDSVRFDWMAQYFASRGYLVLQPNFRGSSGFGQKFEWAGHGEWGRLMQSDITAGLDALIEIGWADKDRVCIVGASYGGFAALAGGAFTPDRYKCIAAIAPVSDLPEMLDDIRIDNGLGSYSYEYEYWAASIGDIDTERDELKAASPAWNADEFTAPVLLVHGHDDTVVKLEQSRRMKSALKAAGKTVNLIELPHSDHWMATSPARTATLKAVATFVEANNPARAD